MMQTADTAPTIMDELRRALRLSEELASKARQIEVELIGATPMDQAVAGVAPKAEDCVASMVNGINNEHQDALTSLKRTLNRLRSEAKQATGQIGVDTVSWQRAADI